MHKLTEQQWQELTTFRIVRVEQGFAFSAGNYDAALSVTKAHTGAELPRVVSSMWVRRYAFFVVSQLFMLSNHRLSWSGKLQDVSVIDTFKGENWLPSFYLNNEEWHDIETEVERIKAMKTILGDFAGHMIHHLAKQTKVSRMTLWENIWGYVIWMYSTLISKQFEQVNQDLHLLLENEIWEGIERRSPFQRFLNKRTVEEAMTDYKRLTCCLYIEIEGCPMCPYCPKVSYNR